MQKTCAFTGSRPHNLPFGDNETSPEFLLLSAAIQKAIAKAIQDGYRTFLSGGAMGVDLWCAETVLKLKPKYPSLQLHFYLPCETQANSWPEPWRERYFSALAQADEVIYIQQAYTNGCMFRRNRAMVDAAARLIAVYDGQASSGGTAYTVRYANKKGVEIALVWPF